MGNHHSIRCYYYKILFSFGVGFLLFQSEVSWSNTLPPKAQALLNSFPGKTLSLELIVGRAQQSSDSYSLAVVNQSQIDAQWLTAKAALDTTLSSGISYVSDQNEATSSFATTKNVSTVYSLGAETRFRTGTTLSAELQHSNSALEYATLGESEFHQTTGKISLSQDLWKNAFGIGVRHALTAGELSREVNRLSVLEKKEEWLSSMIDVYYRAWLAQANVLAAERSLKLRNQLLKITRIKLRRGTSERPDFLQARNAHSRSQIELESSKQALGDIWRHLVLSLKLPEDWIFIDPILIPIQIDEPIEDAKRLCGKDYRRSVPGSSTISKLTAIQAKANQKLFEQAKNNMNPNLTLGVSLESNGVDEKSGETFSEMASVDHPNWGIGLNLSFPLSRHQQRAELQQATANRDRAETQASQASSDLKVNWINACSDLSRLNRALELRDRSYKEQAERVRLEERRFRIGKVPLLNVIQAGDDLTAAEIALKNTEVETRTAAWRVKQLYGHTEAYLYELSQQNFQWKDR